MHMYSWPYLQQCCWSKLRSYTVSPPNCKKNQFQHIVFLLYNNLFYWQNILYSKKKSFTFEGHLVSHNSCLQWAANKYFKEHWYLIEEVKRCKDVRQAWVCVLIFGKCCIWHKYIVTTYGWNAANVDMKYYRSNGCITAFPSCYC